MSGRERMRKFQKSRESSRMKCREIEEEDMLSSLSKKRKVHSDLVDEDCDDAELVDNSVSPAASRTSSFPDHEDSSDVEKKNLRSSDLENGDSQCEGYETEISTSNGRVFSWEMTPTSEVNSGDSDRVSPHLSSLSEKKSSSEKIPNSGVENMPSAAELEAFFAAAEKIDHKRFAEKYNYDIVKDLPLEGEYQWVRLLP